MEFEQMKKIWDEQKQEALYVINEEALHNSVKSKKRSANRIININEIGLILINVAVVGVMIKDAFTREDEYFDLIGAGVMLLIIGYIFYIRGRRRKEELQFDRSLLGELDHAIASTAATIRLGTTMVYWYFAPLAAFSISKMLYKGADWQQWLLVSGLFILGYFVANWDVKRYQANKLKRLQNMRIKFLEEVN